MRPKTLSASSLNVADLCLARYHAENILYTPSDETGKSAANVGTACHFALEKYVELVYMKKTHGPDIDLLRAFYMQGYLATFDTVEYDTPEYRDGLELVEKWFHRTDLSDVTVVSVEQKRRFPLPTSIGDIPVTYIWDRCDIFTDPLTGKKVCRIVDYKSIRAQLGHEDVRNKLQARIYDLMARIQFRGQGIEEYQVVFDLLRHEPVGVIYSRDEAEATWDALKARAERIIATPDDRAPETLNPECAYCVRKLNCRTLQRNIAGGGKFGIELDQAVDLRYTLANQLKGIEAALNELDEVIVGRAEELGELELSTESFDVKIFAAKRRTVDVKIASEILGPELMKLYGKLGVGDIDKVIKSGVLTDEQIALLKRAFGISVGSPSVKITPKPRA